MKLYFISATDTDLLVQARTRREAVELWRSYCGSDFSAKPQKVFLVQSDPDAVGALAWGTEDLPEIAV